MSIAAYQTLKFALIVALSFAFQSTASAASSLQVEVFAAKAANVNSFIFSDSVGSLIVDSTRNSKDALEVAKLAKKHGTDPKIIFITHGHPDHYLGMGALKREFPQSKIFVASQGIKDDILASAQFLEQIHVLDDEPLMKPKTAKNPNGFDYQNDIHVLNENFLTLPAGEKVEVFSNFPATEAAHETLLFSNSLNSVFASDLVYNGVHLWLRGVDAEAIKNWQTMLKQLKKQYSPLNAKVYTGHGKASDTGIFDLNLKYIEDFFTILRESKNHEEAKAKMIEKYPTWENAEFILTQSIKYQFELLNRNGEIK